MKISQYMGKRKQGKEKLDIDNLPTLLRISEAAEVLNVIPLTLRNWDNQGKLKAIRIGSRRDRRYKREDILKVLNEGLK